MIRKFVVLVTFFFLLSTSVLQAVQVPRSQKDFPIYPGSVKNSASEDEIMAEEKDLLIIPMDTSEEHPMVVRSFSVYVHTVDVSAEKVLGFYVDRLDPKEEDPSEYLYTGERAPGSTSEVYYGINFVDFTVYSQKDAMEAEADIKKVRVPLEPGKWVASADFTWEVGEQNSDVSIFDLTVRDDFFHTFNAQGEKTVQTSIVLRKTTYMNRNDALLALEKFNNKESDEDFSKELDTRTFDTEESGIPLYPGAVHDAETESFLRDNMGLHASVYQSDDNVTEISSFFEDSGLKRIHADKEGVLLKRCAEEYNPYLKKTMSTSDCDVEITIQSPWMDMKTGKLKKNTLISIVDHSEQ
jgi:hypothetical protein